MKRRNFLLQFFIGVLAFLFGYKIKQDDENISLYPKQKNTLFGYYPEDYRKDNEKDYTNAFSHIISEIQKVGHGSIILSHNKVYKGDLIITTSNVNINGKGILKGTIKIEGEKKLSETDRYSGTNNITINEITIDGEGKRHGITIQYVYGITIDGVFFKDCIRSITVNSIDYRQHVSRLDIINNHFIDCQYAYFVHRGTSKLYICGDVKFSNNTDESTPNALIKRIATIVADGQDGIIINGNVMFGGSGTNKNIYINNANWITIGNNNLFAPNENCIHIRNSKNISISSGNNCAWAKKDAILLEECSAFTVSSNTISWYQSTGLNVQGFTGSGIVVKDNQLSYGNISSNTILFPYRNGIRLEKAGRTTVGMNTIQNFESKDEAIFADGDLNHILGNSCIGFVKKNSVLGSNSIDNQSYVH
ncbi:right-handed parallel beta-helix repeat-containing protein [Bacillus sp. ISL-18]|uniref:right-handed parallel beta-helix repeat-containing protein n=1 Tax=Bacillus sp. ISL-18 TaxID=2819118 RepID=UPI001BE70476|nr:right-handed parallel beta-helix repeat-containing protein [Bacillus sp. ISL-18]MBT2658620.1 right-handed parallel beta-helix repeat-containing protein [Bacillus sp. ISL-18]